MNTSHAKLAILGMAMMTAFALPVLADGRGEKGAQLSMFDTNSDGQISAEEMAAHQQARFAEADADGNGQLSADELMAHRQTEQLQRMERQAAKMIERMDTNGDGSLSFEEMSKSRATTMFERIDINKDGSIDMEEFTEMQSHGPRGKRAQGQEKNHHEHGEKHGHKMDTESNDG